jgi:hypothetical protein
VGVHLAARGWRTLAASVVGTAHAAAGLPCADACAVRVLRRRRGKGRLLVAVAADGAGTSERAPAGARLACEAVVGQATRWAAGTADLPALDRQAFVPWLGEVQERIATAARAEGRESRDFSCTLLVALVGRRRAAFFQIGDGAIVYRAEGSGYRPALWPQSGEYANCTWFITDEEAAERVQAVSTENVHEVALLTDGLQGLALRFDTREAHGPFFEPMFARLRGETTAEPEGLLAELRAFLGSALVNQRTDDDKTLVLATRLEPADASGSGTGPEA